MNSRLHQPRTGLFLTLAFVFIPLVALCAAAASAHAPIAAQSPSPVLRASGRIAFTNLENFFDGKDIYTVNPDGTGRARLIGLFSNQEDPAWSPDGKYIAYASGQRGYSEIWRADADGSNQLSLSDGVAVGAVDDFPAWSPDGSKIVFVRNRQLWTIDRDGGTAVKLSTGSDEDEQPSWSPDGSKIVFVRNYSSATAQVWVMDADGSNQRNLSNYEWGFNRFPAWSPDGSKIAFQRWNDIWLMDADGANQTQITFAASGGYLKPAWSPDGTQLVVANDVNFAGDIFVMNADGSNITKIADGVHPTWQSLPALVLTAADSPDPVAPGAQLTYTLEVTNNHTLTATGATLTDALDAGTTFVTATSSHGSCATPPAGASGTVTCSLGDLATGERATVTLVVNVAAADGATLHNSATVTADYSGHGRQAQTAETSTQVLNPNAEVGVYTWIGDGLYTPLGGQVVYDFWIVNGGPATAEGVTLTSNLPAGVTLNVINDTGGSSCASTADGVNFTCAFGSLARYEGRNMRVTVNSDVAGVPYTPVRATFNVASITPDSTFDNNNSVVDFFIAAPPLPTPTPGAADEGMLAYVKQSLSTEQHDVYRQRADGAGTLNLTGSVPGGGSPAGGEDFIWSPDGSRLAFVRYDSENQFSTLGTVAADGSGLTLLSSVPGELIDTFSWSPDGSRLVFSSHPYSSEDQNVGDVFVINADGTGRTNLTSGGGFNGYATWSPDGARIAYVRMVYGAEAQVSAEIRIAAADGSGYVQISQAAGEFDSFPRWSPDGEHLAFARDFPDGSTNLYTARADGTDLRRLTDDPTASDIYHQWSPDGSKLSFTSYRPDEFSKLEVMNADGSGRTTIYQTTSGALLSYSTAWSPDGTRLVFQACGGQCPNLSIYVIGADGAGLVELVGGVENNYGADWSPDSRRLAFGTNRNGVSRINLINADGTGRVELPGEAGYYGAPKWRPRKALVTPVGTNVTVAENGVALTFANVTNAGVTTITPIDPNSLQGLPGEYVISAGSLAFEIHTTAAYTGTITLGFQVPGIDSPDTFSALRILHGEPPPVANFVDRTVLAPDSPSPDFATRTIYARVTSLSPFVVARKSARYGVRALYDQTKTHKSGSTVPIKLQLTNAAGANVSSSSLVLRATGTTFVSTNASGALEAPGKSNPDFDFRYDAGLVGYVFNLKTNGYAPGTYVLNFRVAGEPAVYGVQFRIVK
ncbi:MAG TPA: DPP IV N-terminal domain-containing protein [Pyrinomonadaceae bacterium]|jgi:TolB protein